MRNKLWIPIAVLVVAVIASLWYWKLRKQAPISPSSRPAAVTATALRLKELAPLPAIALEINAEGNLETFQGTPLVLTVRVVNQRAANIESENRARRKLVDIIQEKSNKGEINAQKAELMLRVARQTQEAKTVQLGSKNQGWEQFLHFESRKEGRSERLNWTLAPVAQPSSKFLVLDARNRAEVTYALGPDEAGQLSAGSMEVVAVLEVPATGDLPTENWRGRVESGPVKVTILAKPASPSFEQKGIMNLQFADFYAGLQDWPNVISFAEKSVAANPKLIPAYIRLGDGKEGSGDLNGARDAYATAETLFYEQYPNSYEEPRFLILKIGELDRRIGR